MSDFGSRLAAVIGSQGPLCLGVDPHPFLLSDWGLPDSAEGVREFSLRAVEAAAGTVGIIKPQVAFFERLGSAGYGVLEEVLASARAADLLVIADVKRGDIGSTVAAYGEAWLTPGSPLEADAMTVVAFQGLEALGDPIDRAIAAGKGVFVLAATSNPEATPTQTAVMRQGSYAGRSVAAGIVAGVNELNSHAPSLGSVGVVLGATVDIASYGIDCGELTRTPVLAPGFGEQGARIEDLGRLYPGLSGSVIANVGRAVLRRGTDGLVSELIRLTEIARLGVA